MHFSEFMDEDGPGIIISAGSLRACLDGEIKHVSGSRVAFCDWASGGDENCIAVADGNKAELIRCWRDTDPIRACKDFISEFQRLRLIPAEIFGDGSGMGSVMIAYLAEMGWRIMAIHNGSPAQDEDHYANRGSEMWFQASKQIVKKEIILPNDGILFRQLTSRRRDYDSKMRLRAEPKETMATRGLKSPDRADGVLGALYCRQMGAITREQLAGIYLPSGGFEHESLEFNNNEPQGFFG
jgi:hypothetical protein